MSSPDFARWKNETSDRLGSFDATLQKAEQFLDALYKVYKPISLESDGPKDWELEKQNTWNKCDDVDIDYCTTNDLKKKANDDIVVLWSYDKYLEAYNELVRKLRFLMNRFMYGLGEK